MASTSRGSTRNERRAVVRLMEIAECGTLRRTVPTPRYLVPEGLLSAYELYENSLASRGLKETAVRCYLSAARQFLSSCGATRPSELGGHTASRHSVRRVHAGQFPQTRAGQLHVVRYLARALVEVGMCGPSMAAYMLLIPGRKRSSVLFA